MSASIRTRSLPLGWYPGESRDIQAMVSSWAEVGAGDRGARAAVAPHAGWAFSGRLAWLALSSLGDAQTVVVVGGHLPDGSPVLAAREQAFESPLGPLESDTELLQALGEALARIEGPALRPDGAADNTVEVQLPLVRLRFPGARVLWLRAPNGPGSLALGAALASAADSLGRIVVCLGSTDLTHYGPAYGFSPRGGGRAAESWVRNTNDRAFIDSLLALDALEAIRLGEEESAACSSGAAAAVLAFARERGAVGARLLGYATSLDVRRDESFVGYAALAFF